MASKPRSALVHAGSTVWLKEKVRMRSPLVTIGLLALVGATTPAASAAELRPVGSETIANFTLPDQAGAMHELYGLKAARAVVISVQGNGCPIVRVAANTLKALQAQYEPQGVTFLMLNSNAEDTATDVAAEAKEWGYRMPILLDSSQAIGRRLGLTRTAEVFVINPKTWQVVYRGPVDDRTTYGQQKAKADNPWVAQAIDATLAGRPAAVSRRDPEGCLINFTHQGTV